MTGSRRTSLLAFGGMLGSAALAAWARPTILVSDRRPDFSLEDVIPASFADWVIDRNTPVLLPPPDQQALLNKIYNQTLARTYVDPSGYRIMLSLAYGGDQSDGLTLHIPEVCYVGQGFRQESAADAQLALGAASIPVRRLVMTLGPRVEPITYWIRAGDEVTTSTWQRRLVGLSYGLRRQIPDGLLVRVSSIDRQRDAAYDVHDRFIKAMVASVQVGSRDVLLGNVLA